MHESLDFIFDIILLLVCFETRSGTEHDTLHPNVNVTVNRLPPPLVGYACKGQPSIGSRHLSRGKNLVGGLLLLKPSQGLNMGLNHVITVSMEPSARSWRTCCRSALKCLHIQLLRLRGPH